MKKTEILIAIICGLILMMFPTIVSASTTVTSPHISEDTHWTKEGSPYLLKNDLVIDQSATLLIDPGVIIKSDNAVVEVYGNIIASGTEQDKIYFTSYTDDSLGGDSNGDGIVSHDDHTYDARGWYFYSTSNNSTLKNIVIKYSADGFYFDLTQANMTNFEITGSQFGITANKSNLSINNLISKNSGTTFSLYNRSNMLISSSSASNSQNNTLSSNNSTFILTDSSILFSNDFEPIYTNSSTGTITAVTLDGGNYNGINSFKSTLTVSSSTIRNFKSSGVRASGGNAFISSTYIEHNNFGIYFQNPTIVVSFSSFLKTAVSKITSLFSDDLFADNSPVTAWGNTIENNYSYGIFNATSFMVSAENNYWGDDTGPFHISKNGNGKGNTVSDNVGFIPWIQKTPQYSSCCSNVLFFPGLEASRLYKQSNVGEDKLWEPNIALDIQDLFLDQKGISVNKNVYTADIIKQKNVFGINQGSIYKSFSDAMDMMVSSKRINTWQAIPYDWRSSFDDIWSGITLKNNSLSIERQIIAMASSSKTGKVSLVGHSTGGLLAKYIIKKLEKEGKSDLVDKLILVASPQLGTPEAISAVLHGDDQSLAGGILMTQSLARAFSENMSSIYGLLPSRSYSSASTNPFVLFEPSVDKVNNFRYVYGASITSIDTLKDFLLAKDGRQKPSTSDTEIPNNLNPLLVANSADVHSLIDIFEPTSTLKIFQIVGFGKGTTESVDYFSNNSCGINIFPCTLTSRLDHKNIKTLDGDGTVVVQSASAVSSSGTYFLNINQLNKDTSKNYNHTTILEVPSVIESIKNILLDDIAYADKYLTSSFIHVKQSNKMELSVHSPVTIGATNSKGQYTGIISKQNSDLRYITEEIPNSSYEEVGEGKYITLDGGTNDTLKVEMKGTGIGTFTYQQIITTNTISTTSTYADIPVNDTTIAKVILTPNSTSSLLLVDEDGDGEVDAEITPSSEYSPIPFLILLRVEIKTLHLPSLVEKLLLTKIDILIKQIKKEKYSKAADKLRYFSEALRYKKFKLKNLKESERAELLLLVMQLTDDLSRI